MKKRSTRRGNRNGSLFEEDYLIRTLGRIAHDPDVALTELVANGWDAGASKVEITIPEKAGARLLVSDNGHGMTRSQFRDRWMMLGYDRLKHQGSDVEFPPGAKPNQKRRAYGHNGIGRHGLLCFADRYEVQTMRNGECTKLTISTQSRETPFVIEATDTSEKRGHGTRLSVVVERHLPSVERIREILSARFLHDPAFHVLVNGASIPLSEHTGLLQDEEISIQPGRSIRVYVIDSLKGAASTAYQGVAFWVNNRLVGTPSWLVGNSSVVDGRSRFAKRYSVVVSTDASWIDDVDADWTRFRYTEFTIKLFDAVTKYTQAVAENLSEEFADDNSEDALTKNRDSFKALPPLARIEVASFAQDLAKREPTISPELLSAAVQAAINLERFRSGTALLEKLTNLKEADVEGLDRMLSQWSVRDALTVLDEIDRRLSVIVAIEKLCSEEATDEVHTLHPLVSLSRWLFGPEFDSNEFASNVTLRKAAELVFKQNIQKSAFKNWQQRPDLVSLADSTYSIVGTESFEGELSRLKDVLIIELKRGRSTVGREELNQTDGYVQDFLSCEVFDGAPTVRAYVVGFQIDAKTQRSKQIRSGDTVVATIQATTYGQLTRTAHMRLFKLKDRIPARFEELTGNDLARKVMNKPDQRPLFK